MKVGVIMGGDSDEREISLLTGEQIINNLDKNKYEVFPIKINNKNELINKIKGIDFAFIALHGKFGEDGTIQAFLETMGIPYSGSGVLASALCMNKDISKKIFTAENIITPKWHLVTEKKNFSYDKIKQLGYPLVVKPNNGGSSIETYIVENSEELEIAVNQCLKLKDQVIIEEYIQGEEITCSIIGGIPMPIISIKAKADFFDYNSKYNSENTVETQAVLSEELTRRIQEVSLAIWRNFKLKAYGRIDIILKDKEIYVLEVNTLPGMTTSSLLPKSASIAGINFQELLDKIIEYSLK